ncbi:MAG: 1-(5-phosphoribosyl)-5-[(5-phosphoribosylamino)methylideneamino] imidazole-4-carboxamide isomerase [Clostridiales bacterium]|jgi:phosphoribosylformimino-5-aminoimidazole carboxamide ribotide isomerase|nr:1-(5-phosphoribosyl)-5-[(5-phosphoribosylamino)methylideneamino] imidazole-4-carboxamide isomerase [Clostridiales bacterium]
MIIFPAIDLLGGRAARLFQGDYSKVSDYGDPREFAKKFKLKGATHIHIVDLDAAKSGSPVNFDTARDIASCNDIFVQLGGGARNEETVEAYFAAGVKRVILGTSALKDPTFTRRAIERYGGGIAIGVDAVNGKAASEGWIDVSQTDSLDFCKEMREIGAEYIIYTDISRDGSNAGANLRVYERLAKLDGVNITAAGGVSSLEDVAALRDMGLYAAILGKAVYTGLIDVGEAIRVAEGGSV